MITAIIVLSTVVALLIGGIGLIIYAIKINEEIWRD